MTGRRPPLVCFLLVMAMVAAPVAGRASLRSSRFAVVTGVQGAFSRAAVGLEASENSGSSHDELFKWINFLIMAGAIGYFLRRPLSDFFADRAESIREALSQGRRALELSEAKLAEIENKLANFEREIAAFRSDSEREMQAERARLKQSAELEAQRILQFAQVQIESATRLAKAQLKKHAAQQAVESAEALIRQRLDEPARERLVGNFLAGLKRPELKN